MPLGRVNTAFCWLFEEMPSRGVRARGRIRREMGFKEEMKGAQSHLSGSLGPTSKPGSADIPKDPMIMAVIDYGCN